MARAVRGRRPGEKEVLLARLNLRGRLVTETTGPAWHLAGVVRRDKSKPNELRFSRLRDALSPQIDAVASKMLPAVQLTDLSGDSVVLTNVRITAARAQRGSAPKAGAGHARNDSQLENYSFVFQEIIVGNPPGRASAPDERRQSSR